MDTVINRLSEIEAAAGAIVEEANARKKAFAEEMDAKTAAFDKSMEQETARRIAEIQEKMEAEMNGLLNYIRHHEEYAEALFQKMIKG